MSNPGGEIMRIQSIAPRDWGLLILRLGLGITLILHGYPKFAGAGPMAFARYLRVHHFPAPLFSAWFMALVEFVGGVAIVAGFQTTYVGYLAAFERPMIAWRLKLEAGVAFMAARGVGGGLAFLLSCLAVPLALLGAGGGRREP